MNRLLARSLGKATIVSATVLAILIALPLASASDHGDVQASYEITTESADPDVAFEAFDAETLAVFDLDGDGTKEIIAHNDNNNAYVFDGSTGDLIAELETNHPEDWEARELAGISVGDVNGNDVPDIVIANSAGWVTAFEARPALDANEGLEFEKLWENRMDPRDQDPDYLVNHPWADFEGHPALDGSAYLADATNNGEDEIYLQLDGMPSLYAMNGTGEVRWWNNWSDGNANPIATDFTGDDRIEVMYPSDGGQLFFFDAKDHYPLCTFDATEEDIDPGSISVAPTVADLDGDDEKEILFGARDVHEDEDDPDWVNKSNAHYFAVSPDCEVIWHQTWDWSNPHVHMHPVPVDLTGDGHLDVVFQDWNTIGHNPGDWEVSGNPNLFAVEGDTGELIWQTQTQSTWSNDNIALADVNEDGNEEILVVETRGTATGLMLYSLQGDTEEFVSVPESWNTTRGPAVADLTGNGELEIVLPVHKEATGCERDLDVGCREGALFVYETPGRGEPTWPNTKYYNDAYDQAGEDPRAPNPSATVDEIDEDQPTLALAVSGDGPIQAVHVNVPGTSDWQQLDAQAGDRYEAELTYSPAPGDTVQTRILYDDHRASHVSFEAAGSTPLLELEIVDTSADPIGNANVTIEEDGRTVWEGTSTSDGLVRLPLEPGTYDLDVTASGYEDAASTVTVDEEGVTTHSVEMRASGLLWGISWVGLLGGTGVLGVALVAGFVVLRRRSWFA